MSYSKSDRFLIAGSKMVAPVTIGGLVLLVAYASFSEAKERNAVKPVSYVVHEVTYSSLVADVDFFDATNPDGFGTVEAKVDSGEIKLNGSSRQIYCTKFSEARREIGVRRSLINQAKQRFDSDVVLITKRTDEKRGLYDCTELQFLSYQDQSKLGNASVSNMNVDPISIYDSDDSLQEDVFMSLMETGELELVIDDSELRYCSSGSKLATLGDALEKMADEVGDYNADLSHVTKVSHERMSLIDCVDLRFSVYRQTSK
ncbi:hypothetical protein HOA92_00530 [archaeon]|jgi:hypothetical protein|nr:hypothetical protein [archaeon]MBT6761503.1 hypothetical protein [archaeon]